MERRSDQVYENDVKRKHNAFLVADVAESMHLVNQSSLLADGIGGVAAAAVVDVADSHVAYLNTRALQAKEVGRIVDVAFNPQGDIQLIVK